MCFAYSRYLLHLTGPNSLSGQIRKKTFPTISPVSKSVVLTLMTICPSSDVGAIELPQIRRTGIQRVATRAAAATTTRIAIVLLRKH